MNEFILTWLAPKVSFLITTAKTKKRSLTLYTQLTATDFDEDKALIWDLSLPEDLVEGSARAWVTAVGDLMGPALQVK